MKQKAIAFSPYGCFACLGMVVMIASDLFQTCCPSVLGYADEGIALCCILFSAIRLVYCRGQFHWYYCFLAFAVIFGLLGNLFSGIQSSPRAFLMDVFVFLKPYTILLFFHITLNQSRAEEIYRFTLWLSKGMLFLLAGCSVLTLAVPMGMRAPNGSFYFLAGFTGTVGWWTIFFLAVLSSDPGGPRTLYFLLSALIEFRSGSGLGLLSLALAVLVYVLFERGKKVRLKWYQILLFLVVGFWVGRNEVSEYLLNSSAPRFLLFYYSFVTAFHYFPLGSGFATYGSAAAITYYSKLYYRYGFSRRWGMTRSFHPFLMDSYYPQIIAQFGFPGAACYAVFLLGLFFRLILRIRDKYFCCSCLYLFLCWCIAGLGFGTASSWGCTIYLMIPVLAQMGRQRETAPVRSQPCRTGAVYARDAQGGKNEYSSANGG